MASHTFHPWCYYPRTIGTDGWNIRRTAIRGCRANGLDWIDFIICQSRCPKRHAKRVHHRHWIHDTGRDDDADLFQIIWI